MQYYKIAIIAKIAIVKGEAIEAFKINETGAL